jgi:hypothetical protein
VTGRSNRAAAGRLDGLILMDTAHGPLRNLDPDLVRAAVSIVREQGIDVLAGILAEQQGPLSTSAHQRLPAGQPGYAEFGDRKLRATSPAMYAAMAPAFLTAADRLDDLSALPGTLPVLVIAGEQDKPFLSPSRRMAGGIGQGTLALIPDAGHSPQFENPAAWWDALAGFLARAAGPRGRPGLSRQGRHHRGPGSRPRPVSSYRGGMLTGVRLRQVALVAHDCDRVAGELQAAFGWAEPYRDPGVGQFGLTNAVFAAGDTFVEVVAPAQAGTTARRYLDRRGGDGGYMAIFQVPDLVAARARLAGLGVRVVWTADLPDIAGTHLHPKDVPGAIVSLDWAEPAGSWRWAGPAWTGGAPVTAAGGVTGLKIEVADPGAAARRWAEVLGLPAPAGAALDLPASGQRLEFAAAPAGHGQGITAITIAGLPPGPAREIAGVTFTPARPSPGTGNSRPAVPGRAAGRG